VDVLNVLIQETAQVERLVHGADLAAPVGSCPGWTVYDLVTHLGAIHRWAAAATRASSDGPEPADPEEPQELDTTALARWYAVGAAELVDALSVDVARSCWTLAQPHTVGFWRRRQLHETVLHRWDLQTALGQPSRIDAEVALDGIDEVLTVMLPRQVRLGRVEESSLWVRLRVDRQDRVLATSARRDPQPVATVLGDAQTILLLLWGRLGPERVVVDGDRDMLQEALRGALTP
jgi:uncharacterized protein (TIGR03083 family)